MGAASASTETTSFTAPTITPGLVNATNTATPAIPTTAMEAAGSELLHQRLEQPNERIADNYRNYCNSTVIIQQFSSPNISKHNGLSEQDGCTIMDVVR